jgi:hypothetical protein
MQSPRFSVSDVGSVVGPEPPVFSTAVEKLKSYNIQDYNFACGSVWV